MIQVVWNTGVGGVQREHGELLEETDFKLVIRCQPSGARLDLPRSMMPACQLCGRPMIVASDIQGDPRVNCGGDCAGCMAEVEE